MDEDEIVVDPQLDVTPDESDPIDPNAGTDPDTGLTWKLDGDNRYVWEDGKITNADGQYLDPQGNIIPDEPEPVKPATVFHTPAPVVTPAPAPAAVQPAPKWTPQLAYGHIYNDQRLQEIADLSITDPLEAERKRSTLNAEYQNALAWINSQASTDFDVEMDQLQRGAPTVFELYGREINRVRQRMRTDELQSPGAAKRVVFQAMQEAMGHSTDSMEEFAQRVKGRVAGEPQKRRQIAKPDVIPPEDRIPGPGTARRVAPRAKAAEREDDYVKFYRDFHKGNPSITEYEIKEMAENARRLDADRMRRAGVA